MIRRPRKPARAADRAASACIAVAGAVLALGAIACTLSGCNAVRQAPADWKYAETAVVDWVADVVGYQPPEY